MGFASLAEIIFVGRVIEWRGPAPFYFVGLPDEAARALQAGARRASYGWGCVPVVATIGQTEFRTSLFPKNGSYLLPLKATVRGILEVVTGDQLEAGLRIDSSCSTDRRR